MTATPTQTEIEDKVTATRSGDGPSYTWEVTTDPTGGTNPKTFRFVVGFDSQGKMNTLSGLHGTVTTYGGGWLPDTSGG